MRIITIVNMSTVVKDADFQACVAALQKQVDEHFSPAWGGLSAKLVVGTGKQDGEALYVVDDADQAGALGYHELTPNDVPVGYCFAKTSMDDNSAWQVTLSHELLEQLVDPLIDACVVVQFLVPKARKAVMAAVEGEVCDPVEEDQYLIDGVPVSNFVLPAWFQSANTPGVKGPYDYMGKLSAPLTMTPGGYIGYTTNLKSWRQATAKKSKYNRVGRRVR